MQVQRKVKKRSTSTSPSRFPFTPSFSSSSSLHDAKSQLNPFLPSIPKSPLDKIAPEQTNQNSNRQNWDQLFVFLRVTVKRKLPLILFLIFLCLFRIYLAFYTVDFLHIQSQDLLYPSNGKEKSFYTKTDPQYLTYNFEIMNTIAYTLQHSTSPLLVRQKGQSWILMPAYATLNFRGKRIKCTGVKVMNFDLGNSGVQKSYHRLSYSMKTLLDTSSGDWNQGFPKEFLSPCPSQLLEKTLLLSISKVSTSDVLDMIVIVGPPSSSSFSFSSFPWDHDNADTNDESNDAYYSSSGIFNTTGFCCTPGDLLVLVGGASLMHISSSMNLVQTRNIEVIWKHSWVENNPADLPATAVIVGKIHVFYRARSDDVEDIVFIQLYFVDGHMVIMAFNMEDLGHRWTFWDTSATKLTKTTRAFPPPLLTKTNTDVADNQDGISDNQTISYYDQTVDVENSHSNQISILDFSPLAKIPAFHAIASDGILSSNIISLKTSHEMTGIVNMERPHQESRGFIFRKQNSFSVLDLWTGKRVLQQKWLENAYLFESSNRSLYHIAVEKPCQLSLRSCCEPDQPSLWSKNVCVKNDPGENYLVHSPVVYTQAATQKTEVNYVMSITSSGYLSSREALSSSLQWEIHIDSLDRIEGGHFQVSVQVFSRNETSSSMDLHHDEEQDLDTHQHKVQYACICFGGSLLLVDIHHGTLRLRENTQDILQGKCIPTRLSRNSRDTDAILVYGARMVHLIKLDSESDQRIVSIEERLLCSLVEVLMLMIFSMMVVPVIVAWNQVSKPHR